MRYIALMAAAAMSLPLPAFAQTQSSFAAFECVGCSAQQMEHDATTKLGQVVFIYDSGAATIRKYLMSFDSTCSDAPSLQGNESLQTGSLDGTDAAVGQSPTCGSQRVADEVPVDAEVLHIFQALTQVRQVNAALAVQATDKTSDPIDPMTGRAFDLRRVAWDLPNGTYQRFMSFMRTALASQPSANNFSPGLGNYLWQFQIASKSVSVQLATAPVAGSIVWDRTNQTRLQVCDSDNNCALLDLSVNGGNPSFAYAGVTDPWGNFYPSPSQAFPSPNWHWDGPYSGGGEHSFGGFLKQHGTSITDTTSGGQCDGYFLVCTWLKPENGPAQLISCTISCD